MQCELRSLCWVQDVLHFLTNTRCSAEFTNSVTTHRTLTFACRAAWQTMDEVWRRLKDHTRSLDDKSWFRHQNQNPMMFRCDCWTLMWKCPVTFCVSYRFFCLAYINSGHCKYLDRFHAFYFCSNWLYYFNIYIYLHHYIISPFSSMTWAMSCIQKTRDI